jgi:hypothetical protein
MARNVSKSSVRAGLLGLALTVLALGALASTAMASSQDAVAYQENAAHTGAITGSSPAPPLTRKWYLDLGTIVNHPLIVDDLVIVAVQNSTTYGDTEIEARDRLTGALVWSQLGGGTYWELGLAADSGRLYAINFDGQLRAFNLDTGALLWERNLTQQYAFSDDPVAADGMVYIDGSGVGSTLWAINGATGADVWVEGDNLGGSTPAVDGTQIYTSNSCGQAWALSRATGATDWYDGGSCSGGGYSTDIVAGGRVYLTDNATGYVFDASTGDSLDAFAAIPGNPPVFSAGLALYPTASVLHAEDPTTDVVKWTYAPTGGLAQSVVATGTTAYLMDGGGNLVAVNLATGTSGWSAPTGFGAPGSPSTGGSLPGLAVGEGTVAVPDNGGLAVFTLPGPDTEITQAPAFSGLSTSAHFEFGSDTAGATFECSTDLGPWAACTSPVDLSGLALGQHTFSVRAVSGVVVDPDPSTRTWTVATSPSTSIVSGPASPTRATTASFTFDSVTTPVTFQCSLDSGPWSGCVSPNAYTGLADGTHTFAVRAVDSEGNVDPTPASTTWIIDTTPPTTSITSAPPSTTTSTIASFGFSASTAATFACELDSSGWQPCTSPWAYGNLAAGSHSFQVVATDLLGNVGPTPAVATWTIQVPASAMNPSPAPPSTILPLRSPPPAVTAAAVMPSLRDLLARIVSELGPRALKRIAAGRSLVVHGVHVPFSGILTVSLKAKEKTAATGLVVTGTSLHSDLHLGVTGSGKRVLSGHLARITLAATLELAGGDIVRRSEVVRLRA